MFSLRTNRGVTGTHVTKAASDMVLTDRMFEVSMLSGVQWLLVIGLALGSVALVEVLKWVPWRERGAASA